MEDGRLQVNFVQGEIVGVSASAGLDSVYKRMFDSACLEASKGSAAIEHGISVIMFGCFWLEAACNLRLEELLTTIVNSQRVGPPLWKMIERRSMAEKLQLLASFSKQIDHREVLLNVQRTFALRNRLAHFRNEYTAVQGPIGVDEFLAKIPDFGDHELVAELRSHWKSHADAILAGTSLIDQIYEEYVSVERTQKP